MQFPPKSPRDLAYLALCIVFFGGIFAFWTTVYSPKEAELAAVQSHIGQLEQNNQRAKAELAKGSVNDLRAQALRYQQNLQLMRQLVPTTNEVPALIEQVSTAARRVDLDINTVTPEPVLQGEQFDTYRYKLTVIGGYHELAEFLTNVGSLTRIVAPVNIELHPSSGNELATGRPKAGQAMLTSKFEIQTYVAKPGGTTEDDMPRSRLKQGAKT